jgi:hypothetical protein
MFCIECGSPVTAQAKFCANCGSPVLGRQPERGEPEDVQQAAHVGESTDEAPVIVPKPSEVDVSVSRTSDSPGKSIPEPAKESSAIVNAVRIFFFVAFLVGTQVPTFRLLAWGGVAGVLVGIWPSWYATKHNRANLENVFMVLCLIAGAAGGVVAAFIVAVVCVSYIRFSHPKVNAT